MAINPATGPVPKIATKSSAQIRVSTDRLETTMSLPSHSRSRWGETLAAAM